MTGFVITPRTVGARVLLPEPLWPLWDLDDKTSSEVPPDIEQHFMYYDIPGMDLDDDTLDSFFTEKDLIIPLPTNTGCSSTLKHVTFEEVQRACNAPSLDKLMPVVSRGRRAHITLAVATDVKPVVTGYDLIYLQEREQASKLHMGSSNGEQQMALGDDDDTASNSRAMPVKYELNGGTLADYGDGVFAIYLDSCLQLTTLFSNFV